MLNKKAVILVAILSAMILTFAKIKTIQPQVQKPSIKVTIKKPKIDNVKLKRSKKKLKIVVRKPKDYIKQIPLSKGFQKYVYNLCKKKNVSFTLIMAICWHESRFQPNKIHLNNDSTYDYSLMQINQANLDDFRQHGFNNIMNPYQNVEYGIELLSQYHKRYNINNSIMAYGLGEMGMRRRLERGWGITKNAKDVLIKSAEYQKLIA